MDKVIWTPGQNLGEVEKSVIAAAMGHYAFDRNRVAGSLGISRRTLDTRIAELRLETLEDDHKKKQDEKISAGIATVTAKTMKQMEIDEEARLAKIEEEKKDGSNKSADVQNSKAGRGK